MDLQENFRPVDADVVLKDVHPGPGLGGLRKGVNGLFDHQTAREINGFGWPPLNCVKQFGQFDDLELIEAKTMAGCRAQFAIGRMRR